MSVSDFCERMTTMVDSSKICCSVSLGLMSGDSQYVATTAEELKDQGRYLLRNAHLCNPMQLHSADVVLLFEL